MTGPVFVSYARKSPDEAPAPAILPQYEGVMHWQNLIGLDQAVGRFVVLADRFRFESEKRSFEMRFDRSSRSRPGHHADDSDLCLYPVESHHAIVLFHASDFTHLRRSTARARLVAA